MLRSGIEMGAQSELAGMGLRRLFFAYGQDVRAYLTRKLRDAETAADLTQETCLRCAEQHRPESGEASVAPTCTEPPITLPSIISGSRTVSGSIQRREEGGDGVDIPWSTAGGQ